MDGSAAHDAVVAGAPESSLNPTPADATEPGLMTAPAPKVVPGIRSGFDTREVTGLHEAERAVLHFDLLRGLCASGEEEFLLRFGAVADLVHADQTLWSIDALERRLNWLDAEAFTSTIRSLKRSGWLESVGVHYRLTSDGLAVYATLARLGTLHTGRDDSLAMGVFDLEASTQLDEDTGPALRHLQHHLRRAVEDVEAAVKSQSEVKVLDARDKLDKNLRWSERARRLLDRIDIEDDQGYRAGQRLGRDLSELHRWHSVMQRVLDEVGKTAVPLGAIGVSAADVSRFLTSLSVDEIIDRFAGNVSFPVWPLVFITDNVVTAAEFELSQDERVAPTVTWSEGEGKSAEIGAPPPTEGEIAFRAFERDLDGMVEIGEKRALDQFLLDGSFPRTCYRMTLLALEDELPTGRATIEADGGPALKLYQDYASEISRGQVVPRKPGAAVVPPPIAATHDDDDDEPEMTSDMDGDHDER